MNFKSNEFAFSEDIPWTDCGDGVRRKIMGYNPQLMVVRVHFQKNAVGSIHSHSHAQVTYIVSGRFEFNIENRKRIGEPGDSVFVTPNLQHGIICLDEGEIIDVFSPFREDFLIQ
jgi:quercetin dioxygenase-like cupin family protein